jgi:hypothetical protein
MMLRNVLFDGTIEKIQPEEEETAPCSLATMAASRSRIGTATSGFMARRMRGSSGILGRASGRCIEGERIEPRVPFLVWVCLRIWPLRKRKDK